MSLLQRLRFLFGFAWQDLFERNARRTTRLLVVTVAILSGFTLVVYGLALGYEKARLQRLRSDPLALCLWAGSPTLGQKIDTTTLQRLRDGLAQRLDGGRLVGFYPFYETEFDWFVRTSDGEPRSASLRGRTLAPGDPLLSSLPLRSGRPFERPDEEGVIVTDNLLRVLENQAGATPATLRLRSRASGAPVEVPVVGVTRGPLPLNHDFLFTEAFELRLWTEDPNVAVPNVRTGPMPADWPSPTALPLAVKDVLETYDLLPPIEEKRLDGTKVWLLRSGENPPPLRKVWLARVQNLYKLMLKHDRRLKPAPDFVRVDVPSVLRKPPPRPGYDQVGIYVRDLPDLKPAAESAQAAGLLVNDDVIQQVEGISRAAGVAVLVLSVVVAILGGLALWNIKVIQELRAFQKVAEIGMLKAIGMSNGLLRQVYLAEATLIWLLGLGGGVVLGIGAGLLIAWHLAEGTEDRFTAFSCPWYLLLGVVGLGGLVCWLSTLWGTRSARRASPIETLSAP